jgi:hypothetical protein
MVVAVEEARGELVVCVVARGWSECAAGAFGDVAAAAVGVDDGVEILEAAGADVLAVAAVAEVATVIVLPQPANKKTPTPPNATVPSHFGDGLCMFNTSWRFAHGNRHPPSMTSSHG